MKTVMDPMKNTKPDCGGDDGDDYGGVAVDSKSREWRC